MTMEKVDCFNGFNGESCVNTFITRAELHASLKGYSEEKAAQYIASRLHGRAFDVYMRLEGTERADVNKLKSELRREFEKGRLDREAALNELAVRRRLPGEAPATFAYKVGELARLAYPSFDENGRNTIAKDYFVRGLHTTMQIALKSDADFIKRDIITWAAEVT